MYKIMFVSGLVLFVLFLLISVILFIKNDIATIMGELTGLRAKRTIRKMLKAKSEKAKAMKESHLGEEILVRTSDLIEEMTKKDGEEKNRTEEIDASGVDEKSQEELKKEAPAAKSVLMDMANDASSQENGSVFESEEDMTVLGGEAFKRVSSKNSVEDITYEAENLEDPETGILSKESYLEMMKSSEQKKEEKESSRKGERTQKRRNRQEKKAKEELMEAEDVNSSEEFQTSVLQEGLEDVVEEVGTMVLEGEDATGILLQKGELDDAK